MQDRKIKLDVDLNGYTTGNGNGLHAVHSSNGNETRVVSNSHSENAIKKRNGIIAYAVSDYLAAIFTWTTFFLYRKTSIENLSFATPLSELLGQNYLQGIITIPICWMILYSVIGTYTDIYRKSRLAELNKTILTSFIGVTVLFFILILDDTIVTYKTYYQSYLVLFILHLGFTFFGRLVVLSYAKRQMEIGKFGYRTLIIGGNKNAMDLYKEINSHRFSLGYKLLGFIDMNGGCKNGLGNFLPKLGKIEDVPHIISNHEIEDVIIAIETSEHHQLNEIINKLSDQKVVVRIIPDMYDILSGSVKMRNVIGAVLIEISSQLMPAWQRILKRIMDIVVSSIVLILLIPVYAMIALQVRLSSPGSIFFIQERIGLHGRPFRMYKFRSMFTDAEEQGPMLSKEGDDRITHWGKIMRKWRLDELPQFYNVLIGDMSLVGPRPERQFYIDQITEIIPHYKYLHKVKPGITSWGMVKFGYASSVEEMIKRMKYDLLYIENMSLAVDFRIMIYTIMIIFQGKGK